MRKWEETVTRWYIRGMIAWNDFKDSERGDTNFIAIAVIAAVIVVLAATLMGVGERVMNAAEKRVTNYINGL